jgi:hypothetical protein
MAEWSIAAVLKTVDCKRSGGSNPSLSAKEKRVIPSDYSGIKKIEKGFVRFDEAFFVPAALPGI